MFPFSLLQQRGFFTLNEGTLCNEMQLPTFPFTKARHPFIFLLLLQNLGGHVHSKSADIHALGVLLGSSPSRIRWFRSFFADNFTITSGPPQHFAPTMGALTPHVELCGTNAVVANVLSTSGPSVSHQYIRTPHSSTGHAQNMRADSQRFVFVHVVQEGVWSVPTHVQPCALQDGVAPWAWQVLAIDYWDMVPATVGVLPCNATAVTLDVPAVPANYVLTTPTRPR